MDTKRSLTILLGIVGLAAFAGLVWFVGTRLAQKTPIYDITNLSALTGRTDSNCTYSISFWVRHPELYPPQVVIGEQVYGTQDISKILTDGSQDVTVQLQGQLLVAFLNFLAGSNQIPMEATIFEAYGWMVAHPSGSQISDIALLSGAKLYDALEAYNEGLSIAEPCEGTRTPTMTFNASQLAPTSTPSPTTTPTTTPTWTVTITPTPTGRTATPTRTRTVFVPTFTSTRTPDEGGPPLPTRTRTPITPTTPAPPINTPLPTSTFTLAPPPIEPTFTPTETFPPPPGFP